MLFLFVKKLTTGNNKYKNIELIYKYKKLLALDKVILQYEPIINKIIKPTNIYISDVNYTMLKTRKKILQKNF